jgi:Tol biopolymer transport system component
MRTSALFASAVLLLCVAGPVAASGDLRDPREVHLANVVQLTDGGENAEGYWSPDGTRIVFQSTHGDFACDQIFVLPADGSGPPTLVSAGEGRTTCSYFTFPDADRILYATTHLAGPECPPPPDRSAGYVWALYDGYDIVSVAPDGSDLSRVTDTPGYDAEATVCPVDGRVIFTSVRDGDLELYTMNPDGSDVTRITSQPGYDGGAFFSPDCSKIVWRASRPRTEKERSDYQELLERGLIRPGRLELWVANADGTDARQITWFGAASFAPSFFPRGDRILFSSNLGAAGGREFDLWALDTDGTDLERITFTDEFDGFPLFSPDGTRLAFASNRHHARDGETNLFVARWQGGSEPAADRGLPPERAWGLRGPDRYLADVAWLAGDAREGRGIGTQGLVDARDWLVARFTGLGLEPGGDDGGWLQRFDVPVAVEVEEGTALSLDGEPVPADAWVPAGFSGTGTAAGDVVAAGHGIVAPELGIDDYAGLDVTGKVVAVRRFTPAAVREDDDKRRYSDVRYKAIAARERGAAALIVVDLPLAEEAEGVDEAPLPGLRVEPGSDVGIPVAVATQEAAGALFEPRPAGEAHGVEITVNLEKQTAPAWNVVARRPADAPEAERLPGAVIVGAHYDHLGLGGPDSMAPGSTEPHSGADDNASGTAAVLEAARWLTRGEPESMAGLRHDVVFVAFSGEETGILGSTAFARKPPGGLDLERAVAMVNLDMVGRLREKLTVLGDDSAAEWPGIVRARCQAMDLPCAFGGDAYGPSDHTAFYAAGVPVLYLFTGPHADYHKPSDDPERIHAAGGAQIARFTAEIVGELAARPEPLTYRETTAPAPRGDVRSYGASLGVVPDYAGEAGATGMLLAGVRPGGPADQAGLRRDDRLVELAGTEIRDVHDLVYVLRQAKPGQTVQAVVMRAGERVELEVTFGESQRPRG